MRESDGSCTAFIAQLRSSAGFKQGGASELHGLLSFFYACYDFA